MKIKVHIFGEEWLVPENITILEAFEYSNHKFAKNCGCRSGFCGSCAVLYRLSKNSQPKACPACQTLVKNGMYIAPLPSFKMEKKIYDLNETTSFSYILNQLYPEVNSCIECGLCSRNCTKGIDVKEYIISAKNGDFKRCAELSFECVMCNACSQNCVANIPHAQIGMLARRINGRHLAKNNTNNDKENSIKLIETLLDKPIEEIKELYNNRDFI